MRGLELHSENGEPAALVFNGIAVPADSFALSRRSDRARSGRYRLYEKPMSLNGIPLSQRTVELLTKEPSTLMRERRCASC